jgi:hypothetical protein
MGCFSLAAVRSSMADRRTIVEFGDRGCDPANKFADAFDLVTDFHHGVTSAREMALGAVACFHVAFAT